MEFLNNNNIILHNNINNFRNNNDNFMNNHIIRNNRNNRIDRIINDLMNIFNNDLMNIEFHYSIRKNRKIFATYINGGKKEFTTFQECVEYNEGTNTYDNIKILDCSHCNLKKIIWMLPQNLQKFNCSYNKLEQLPWALPPNLVEVKCSHNQLKTLPEHFPVNLKLLDCSHNRLTSLPKNLPPNLNGLLCNHNRLESIPNNLPQTLRGFVCHHNQLRSLPDNLSQKLYMLKCQNNRLETLPDNLPQTLRVLWCNDNQLISLSENLPLNLNYLFCENNKLISLPNIFPPNLHTFNCSNNRLIDLSNNLPLNLRVLVCNNNRLISLPISLTRLRHIREFRYNGNDIQHIPPQVQRWINIIRGVQQLQGYDIQNVHNHSIQKSVRESIEKITSQHFEIDIDLIIEDMLSDNILTEQCKQSIIQYCNNQNVHSVLQLTFKELFGYVWKTIKENEHCDEIKGILNIEMNNARCKCFTGRISRLINCLNGFSDLVRIELSNNEQIGNIIILVKNKLIREDNYNVETHKKMVTRELIERGYSNDVITEWTEYID